MVDPFSVKRGSDELLYKKNVPASLWRSRAFSQVLNKLFLKEKGCVERERESKLCANFRLDILNPSQRSVSAT